MFQAVCFDFDGTLVDSEVVHFQGWMQVLLPYGVSYTEHEFCHLFTGRPTVETAEFLVKQHQLAESAIALASKKNQWVEQFFETRLPPLQPGAEEILQHCKNDGLAMALVTGSTANEAIPVLKGYRFYELFDVVITKDDVTYPKPDPEPYLMAAKQLNIQPQHCVAIEDSATGLESALAADMHALLVPNAHSKDQQFDHRGKRFSDLAGIKTYLSNIAS